MILISYGDVNGSDDGDTSMSTRHACHADCEMIGDWDLST